MNENAPKADSEIVQFSSEFLSYLSKNRFEPGQRLPALEEVAKILGISIGKLREQLEVARTLGLVEVRPKTGIRVQPFSLLPCLRIGLRYALATDPMAFGQIGDLRNHLETTFWEQAVRSLMPEDKERLRTLVDRAWEKLRAERIQIPHAEHRDLHLTIYSRLENPYVRWILEAYWDAYEAVGLNLYADYDHLSEVWTYHARMVDAIESGDYEAGYLALVDHAELLPHRPVIRTSRSMESLPPAAEDLREVSRHE
jgi:DNA-binding FadR family transcriptional regulator